MDLLAQSILYCHVELHQCESQSHHTQTSISVSCTVVLLNTCIWHPQSQASLPTCLTLALPICSLHSLHYCLTIRVPDQVIGSIQWLISSAIWCAENSWHTLLNFPACCHAPNMCCCPFLNPLAILMTPPSRHCCSCLRHKVPSSLWHPELPRSACL